jgi:hypothetical protein
MVPGIQPRTATTGIDDFQAYANSISTFERPYRSSIIESPEKRRVDASDFLELPPITEPIKGQLDKISTETLNEVVSERTEQPSRQYAELMFLKNFESMGSLLQQVGENLNNPDGAKFMSWFRDKLQEIWAITDSLSKDKVILISALEEAIRGKRWRDLTIGQIRVLGQIIKQTENGTLKLTNAFTILHQNFIEISPSAIVDEEDDEGEQFGE